MENYVFTNKNYWADEGDFWENECVIEPDKKRIAGAGMPVVWNSKNHNLAVFNGEGHTIIFGSTGSAKSKGYLYPTVASMIKHGESGVIEDVKGELADHFYHVAKKNGYRVIVLNFVAPQDSNSWNPWDYAARLYRRGEKGAALQQISDMADAITYGRSHSVKEPFWENAASSYLQGLVHLLLEETGDATFSSIMHLHVEGNKNSERKANSFRTVSLLEEYLQLCPNLTMEQALSGTLQNASDTKRCVFSIFHNSIAPFREEVLKGMLNDSDFRIEDIAKEKSLVFLKTPPDRKEFDVLVSIFVKQLFSIFIHDVAPLYGRKLPVRVNFILDEFASFPQIPDFIKMVSLAREYNMRFYLCCQSLEQLISKYGKEDAHVIIENCNYWYVLRGKDHALNKLVSDICGTKILPLSGKEVPLITPHEIQQLKKGQALILSSDHLPFITQMPFYSDYHFFPGEDAKAEVVSGFGDIAARKKPKLLDLNTLLEEKVNPPKKTEGSRILERVRQSEQKPKRPLIEFDDTDEDDELDLDAAIAEIDAMIMEDKKAGFEEFLKERAKLIAEGKKHLVIVFSAKNMEEKTKLFRYLCDQLKMKKTEAEQQIRDLDRKPIQLGFADTISRDRVFNQLSKLNLGIDRSELEEE